MVTVSFSMGNIEIFVRSTGLSQQNIVDIGTTIVHGLEKIRIILRKNQVFNFNMMFRCQCGKFDSVYDSEKGVLKCSNGNAMEIIPSLSHEKWLTSQSSRFIVYTVDPH